MSDGTKPLEDVEIDGSIITINSKEALFLSMQPNLFNLVWEKPIREWVVSDGFNKKPLYNPLTQVQ